MCRDSLCQLPKRCPALYAIFGIILHKQLLTLFALLFEQRTRFREFCNLVLEVYINFTRPLYLVGFALDSITAEQALCQVANSRDGSLRVEFVGSL